MRPSCAALDGIVGNGERQHEGQWSIEQRHGAVAGVPLRRPIILGVDERGHAADFVGDADAAIGRAQQQRAAQAGALYGFLNGQASEAEHRHVITCKALFRERV